MAVVREAKRGRAGGQDRGQGAPAHPRGTHSAPLVWRSETAPTSGEGQGLPRQAAVAMYTVGGQLPVDDPPPKPNAPGFTPPSSLSSSSSSSFTPPAAAQKTVTFAPTSYMGEEVQGQYYQAYAYPTYVAPNFSS
eukprot:gb/GEZN01016744.1/.p2 GENE.gb/GEZN01016744.1/~~gb/GEZN01016744.1/.p2  ORF type:complete len:135 (-),score=10.48 gb/GEZN01016744.1/:6-410(-)